MEVVKQKFDKSKELLERATKVMAGGVSSEFRKAAHPHPLFYSHGRGSRIYDVDGNEYLDFTLSQGPLILGHSHPQLLEKVRAYSAEGQLFAGQHIQELLLAEKLNAIISSAEIMRFCLDGSEAVQTAFRVARARTGKKKFLRFEGHYHGWMDNVCFGFSVPPDGDLGSEDHPNVFPWSEGLPEKSREEFIIIPWNDITLFEETMRKHHSEIAAVITEPVMCNSGCIEAQPMFLQSLRDACTRYNCALIFDEVITGFRLALGGAQEYYGIRPDLSVFAKAMASGYPISAIVGKKEWMLPIEQGRVIHAGTMNAGNPTVAAALATIETLESEQPYQNMYALGKRLMEGLRAAAKAADQNLLVQGIGPVFHTGFTHLNEVNNFRDTLSYDKGKLKKFISALHDEGIRVIGRGLWYISAAHTKKDIDDTILAAGKILKSL